MIKNKLSHRFQLLSSVALIALLLLTGCGKKPPAAFTFNRRLADNESTLVDSMNPRIINSRPIEIDQVLFDLLTAPVPLEPSISIPIFKNKTLVVDILQIQTDETNLITYQGKIQEQPLSSVIISRNGSVFTMDIQAEEGIYQVIYNGEYHELFQMDLPGIPTATNGPDAIHDLPDLSCTNINAIPHRCVVISFDRCFSFCRWI